MYLAVLVARNMKKILNCPNYSFFDNYSDCSSISLPNSKVTVNEVMESTKKKSISEIISTESKIPTNIPKKSNVLVKKKKFYQQPKLKLKLKLKMKMKKMKCSVFITLVILFATIA